MSTAIVDRSDQPFDISPEQRRLIALMIYVGFAALSVGVVNGFAQALNYAHINVFRYYPGLRTYYEGLTVHGVFNAIVFTFAFANGFTSLTLARGLNMKLNRGLLYSALVSMVVGVLFTSYAMFSGKASVLYTFYAPLEANWTFYFGLVLIVLSTWLTSANLFLTLSKWRKVHPGQRVPLLAFISVVTYIFWDIASLGIASEVVLLMLPLSLGLLKGTDPLLSRTLFWFTGHPIVYFWLLPIYISWYGMIPKQVGGALFSDSVVRVSFLLFLCIIPIGFHHQYVDPGVSTAVKAATALLTFMVFLPSLMTAFSVMYALEIGGRRRGGTGLIGWFFKLPWSDPSVSAQVLAMLTFMLGGITGLMNASYNMNIEVHNTAFIPGHFHMTVGSAVALSAMGIAYWLIPFLEQKELIGRKLAVVQSWTYFLGVMIFARGMISGGLAGMPRRTAIALVPYPEPAGWKLAGILTAIGGTLMVAGAVMFFVIIALTVLFGKRAEIADVPFTETIQAPAAVGWELNLDHLRYWIAISAVLIVMMYGPFLLHHIPPTLTTPPFQGY